VPYPRLAYFIGPMLWSLHRFYLETDFSKGHLSQILRGKRSPSLCTIVRLARALDVPTLLNGEKRAARFSLFVTVGSLKPFKGFICLLPVATRVGAG
jgi:transcriptional regulator with XRE-family HTH domain